VKPTWWATAPAWLKDELGGDGYHLPGTTPLVVERRPFGSRRRTTFRNMDTVSPDDVVQRLDRR
jgi:hypothetical protein